MGVTHSMDEKQVARISNALKGSADAIQGINKKFDIAETQYKKLHSFQGKLNGQVEGSLDACIRLDETVRGRVDTAHVHFEDAMEGFTQVLESMIDVLQGLDIQREVSNLPAAMVPLMVPLVILLIELAVANAYMGILIASMPEVRERYSWCSPYLLANASCVLMGLTISLVWLAGYRIWLTCNTGSRKVLREDADDVEDVAVPEERAELAVAPIEEADSDKLREVWERIDVDCSDSMSKLEFISAVHRDPEVAALVLPGVNTKSMLHNEEVFDAVDATYEAICGGEKKPRVCYAEFVDYFRRRATASKDRGGADLPHPFEGPRRKLSKSASEPSLELPSLEERLSEVPEGEDERRLRRSLQSPEETRALRRSSEVPDEPRPDEPRVRRSLEFSERRRRSLEVPGDPRACRSLQFPEEPRRRSLEVPEDRRLEARLSAGSRGSGSGRRAGSRGSGSGRAGSDMLSHSGSWQLGSKLGSSGELESRRAAGGGAVSWSLREDQPAAGPRLQRRQDSGRARGSGGPVLDRRTTDGSGSLGRRPVDFGERRSQARRRMTDRADPSARRDTQRKLTR